MNCETVSELIEDLVLDALPADQAADVRAHLDRPCERCRGEEALLRDALAGLALTCDPVVPPPSVRDDLLRQVERSTPLPPAADGDGVNTLPPVVMRVATWSTYIAASLAAFWFGASAITALSTRDPLPPGAAQMQLAALTERFPDAWRNSRGMVAIELAGTGVIDARGAVMIDRSIGRVYCVVDGLPEPATGDAYSLYRRARVGEWTAVAELTPADDHAAGWTAQADAAPGAAADWAISTQPPDSTDGALPSALLRGGVSFRKR